MVVYQRDLDATSPQVHQHPLRASERDALPNRNVDQARLLRARDDADLQASLLVGPAHEQVPVATFTHSAGGDSANRVQAQAVRLCLEPGQRGDRSIHGVRRELPGNERPVSQSHRRPVGPKCGERTGVRELYRQESNRVRPNVDSPNAQGKREIL